MIKTTNIKCKVETMKTIASVLNVAGKKSVLFYERLFNISKNIIMSEYKTNEDMILVSSALHCLSNLIYSMDETLQRNALGSLNDINERVLSLITTYYDFTISELRENI